MSNWFTSLCAFLLLVVSLSSLTTHIFIQSAIDSFDATKESAHQKNDALVNETFSLAYSQMSPDQKSMIQKLESLPSDQRHAVLGSACTSQNKDQPFCDPRFIAGTSTFETIMKDGIRIQLQNATDTALTQLKGTVQVYEKFNLFWLGIITGLLSLAVYYYANGSFGVQSFLGNVSWLSLLSAISFKLMPALINNLVSSVNLGEDELSKKVGHSLIDIVINWLVPAMHDAFVFSIWLVVIGCFGWLAMRFFRNYDVVKA